MFAQFLFSYSDLIVLVALYFVGLFHVSILNAVYVGFFIVFAVDADLRRRCWKFMVRRIP